MNTGRNILLGLIVLVIAGFSILSIINPTGEAPPHHSKHTASQTPQDDWIVEIIPPGGSLYSVMEKNAISPMEIALTTFQFGDYIDVTTIQPGDTLKIKLDPVDNKIQAMTFIQEPTVRHQFTVRGDSLLYTQEKLPVVVQTRILEGTLKGTLDSSLLALGLAPADKQQINNGLQSKINFSRDAREGDVFRVLAELRYFEGRMIPGGKILYVSYKGQRAGSHELFRYEDPSEKSVLTGLYGPDGKIVRSSGGGGFGYPLSSIHVRSKFGRRIDPVYGRWAMHQGVDYKASYGTAVFSVGAGVVTDAGYSGGWGNQVRVKHPNGIISQYAHLSSISVRRGQKVNRGQVVGKVGSTGKSTGPHLHFGLMKGGNWINPSQLKMVGTEELTVIQLKDFSRQKEAILVRLREIEAGTAIDIKPTGGV